MSIEQNVTNDIKARNENINVLKKHFSQCFDKNGNINIEKFKQELSANEIDISKESYGLDWLGKSYARVLASDETTTLLKEDEEFNQKEENKNSQNLLIKGDNLEVLKHLSNAYYEQIKMIYIDPPYNTGNDGFAYQDDRKFTVDELKKLAGIDEEKAKRILDFTQSNSNSHSAWLTFMYPRLYIAKELLKEEGAIFISIDDNEASQLKVILDEEIFGEENFIAKVPAIMNLKGNQDNFGFADCHEYFLVYAKNKDKCELFEFDIDEEEIFNDWNEDEHGLWKKADGLRRTGDDASRINRPKGWFPVFITPEDKIYVTDDDKPLSKKDTILYPINDDEEELSWSWGKPKIKNETYNLIVTDARSGGKSIYKKQRPKLGDLPTKKPKSFFYKSDYSTSTATTQLKNLFGKKVFKGPKPVPFIMDLITIGMSKDDTVLDFFGGSGTTGEAIMRLNLSDEGDRKYIMVQLPELLDSKKNKIAYDYVKNELKINKPTVFDITKQRLILSSKQIKEDNPNLENQDLSFKIFETIPIWDDYGFESKELTTQTKLFDESKLTKEDLKALLVTWKTNDGSELTESIEEYDLDGYSSYYTNGKLYLMNKGFTTKNLTFLLEKIDSDKDFNPTSIIAFGYHFESKNLREISENIKSYANKKSIDIDFITRY
ncbi:site-specific DNA-methyltransferase [Mesoflavibacter zeaxanthinifaciens]|uniref:site-specific DNA-methyltransferase n=1 Tax=Mesoflavibacter zeaxanthinifaciens TaxID=393060 RepID=UPI0004268FDF|nr:site-specific DNA-methyltransferase [Mesoflavibacter zeaxanthinifaciens]